MALNSQVFLYSVDTSAFYNKEEMKLHRNLSWLYFYKREMIRKQNKSNKLMDKFPNKNINRWEEYSHSILKFISDEIKYTKGNLYEQFPENVGIRNLNKRAMNKYNIISMFDSSLTRIMGVARNAITEDIIVVQTYFFEILEDIILNGFMYKKEKYICFTASAGQIRTKKTVFVKEQFLKDNMNTITCGLSVETINSRGGVNINKYLAYLALCNSATDEWEGFDITKTIVVEDMETLVNGEVDLIDDKTYEITRQTMDIPISHTDGCGMILKSKKSMMVRLPWVKGLVVPTPFDKFIREKSKETGIYCGIIKDIYGVEHDVLKEKIEVIFTKSQFKMWKYFDSWSQYQENYIKYHCLAGKCNEEEEVFSESKLNYQMLQTLTDITETELKALSKRTKRNIKMIGTDRKTMLKVLGVVESNTNKNYIQQALEIYPELLNDTYSKEILKQVKKSIVKSARAGKLNTDGIYSFICPDLYAFCEFLFLGELNPVGLLKDKEVYCALYEDSPKLDCLRSPSLYKEHAVRKNVVDKEKGRWFITNGLYTSCHDLISKILMFDVDGDKSLIWADKLGIKIAERNMKGIVPLYYNMAKAAATTVSNKSIYSGLKAAYTGGNIGVYSNNITKIFNSENVNLEAVKLLCMENNFTIDYAKTLYKPKRPKEKQKLITDYTKAKVPHFFVYAKDKDKSKVEKANNSTVNKLLNIIPNPNINFKALNLGKFDYTTLMRDTDVIIDTEIVEKYIELDLRKHFMMNYSDEESNNITYLYEDIKSQILEVNSDIYYVTDVIIKYLYVEKNSSFKTTLWECFGDIIVDNLKNNIPNGLDDGNIQCEVCGDRIEDSCSTKKYCERCAKKIWKEQVKLNMREYRKRKRYKTNEVCSPTLPTVTRII